MQQYIFHLKNGNGFILKDGLLANLIRDLKFVMIL